MQQRQVVRSALHTEIFQYVAACPNLQVDTFSIRKQFTCQGYSTRDIDLTLTDLQKEGSVSLTDDGFIRIGEPTN